MRKSIRLSFVAVFLAALIGGASLSATIPSVFADSLITFDDLANGTTLSNQYDAQGVDFIIQGGQPVGYPVIDNVGSLAQSSPNVAAICTGCEPGDPPLLTGNLTNAAKYVELYAGHLADGGPTGALTTLTVWSGLNGTGTALGTDSATLNIGDGVHTLLKYTTGAAQIESFTVTGPASPGAQVLAIDNLQFSTPSNNPTFSLAPVNSSEQVTQNTCQDDTIDISRFNGSTGNIDFSASNLPTGVSVNFFNPNPATTSTVMELCASASAPEGSASVQVTGTPENASTSGPATSTYVGVSVPLDCDEITATGFNPGTGWTPVSLHPGTPITIQGSSFCPGMTVQFGNVNAQVTVPTPAATSSATVSVPRLATTGPISVISPDGTVTSSTAGTFTVDSYRNQDGFSFNNNGGALEAQVGNGYDLNREMTDVFGYAQTHLRVNFCFPFDCTVQTGIPDPIAAVMTALAGAFIPTSSGLCFGFATGSQRLLHFDQSFSPFPLQSGATSTTVWNLAGPSGASLPVAQYVHEMHVEQMSTEFLGHWLSEVAANAAQGVVGTDSTYIRNEVTQSLNHGNFPLISMAQISGSGYEGHVVVAYNIENAPGGFYIDVYDPNRPFTTGENSDAVAHAAAENNSRVFIGSNGQWSFFGNFAGGSDAWSGGPGGNPLVVTDYGTPPVHPTLLSLSNLTGLVAFGSGTPSQVTDSEGDTMLNKDGTLNTDPKTQIPGAAPFAPGTSGASTTGAAFLLSPKDSYTETLLGSKSGQVHTVDWGDGSFVDTSVSTQPGAQDVVGFNGPSSSFSLTNTTNARQNYSLDFKHAFGDGSVHALSLNTTLGHGMDAAAFTSGGSSLQFAPAGTRTVHFTLAAWGGTSIGSFTSTFAAKAGDTVHIIAPDWTNLSGSKVHLQIHHANGSTSTQVLSDATKAIASFKLSESVKVQKGTATISIKPSVK
ncbi:MAG TPA: hypothetical protein VG815_21565, partial [Chloroflexota bacterium]|nr:hypothetical protein [Chloroflexota bacterium]